LGEVKRSLSLEETLQMSKTFVELIVEKLSGKEILHMRKGHLLSEVIRR